MTRVLEAVSQPSTGQTLVSEAILDQAYRINEDFDNIIASQTGDSDAYGNLYDRHYQPILSMLTRLSIDQGTAEDLAQETFLRGFRKIDQLTVKSDGAGPWFYTIARRIFIDHTRRKVAEPTDPTTLEVEHATSNTLYGPMYGSFENRLVTKMDLARYIGQLSPERQRAIALVYSMNLSNSEAGEILGVPRMTIGSQLSRARQELRERITSHDAS